MSAFDFTIRQGDHGESMTATLLGSDGTAVDLTGATVRLCVAPHNGAPTIVDAVATVDDAASGRVSYVWQVADTANPGTYFCYWQVDFADGARQTFPNDTYLAISITPKLG